MKANELMIGNYVRYTHNENLKEDRRGKVIKLTADDILYLWETKCVLVEPIELSDEWLLKFGLNNAWIDLDGAEGVDVSISTETAWIGDSRDMEYCAGVECRYVHQLQNLYFALTREELVVKELTK